MQSQDPQNELSDEDRELETTLSRLAPAARRIDARDVMLRAEWTSAARRIRGYRAVAALLAIALLASLLTRPHPAARETVRADLKPSPATPVITAAPPARLPAAMMEELRYSQELAEKGLAALPAPPPRAAEVERPEPPIDESPLWE